MSDQTKSKQSHNQKKEKTKVYESPLEERSSLIDRIDALIEMTKNAYVESI